MRNSIYVFVINIAVISTILVIFELAGQVGYYLLKDHWLFQQKTARSQLFEIHPYLVGRLRSNVRVQNNDIVISSTADNTRWTGAEISESPQTKIAVLGGSSTFGTGVTDKDSWPAILQKQLGSEYSVKNFGMPGYSTVEAIVQMALVLPEWKPDIVINYQGWNDIRNYHSPNLGADYYQHGMMQYSNLGLGRLSIDQSFIEKASQVSAWFRLVHIVNKSLFSIDETVDDSQVFDHSDSFVDRIFLRNLTTLRQLSEIMDAKAIFIPQLINVSKYMDDPGSQDWTPYIKSDAMPALMENFNALMSQVCEVSDQKCKVLNEILSLDWSSEDFIDYGHFSGKGGEKFVRIIAAYISNSE